MIRASASTVAKTGDCFQCGPGSCTIETLAAAVAFVPSSEPFPISIDGGTCFVRIGDVGQGRNGRPLARASSAGTVGQPEDGKFTVALDAGEYWSVIERDGCGLCWGTTAVDGVEC